MGFYEDVLRLVEKISNWLEYCQVIHPVDEDYNGTCAMESDSTQRHFTSNSISSTSNDGVSEPDVGEDDAEMDVILL